MYEMAKFKLKFSRKISKCWGLEAKSENYENFSKCLGEGQNLQNFQSVGEFPIKGQNPKDFEVPGSSGLKISKSLERTGRPEQKFSKSQDRLG